jgi:hypothetical protein
MSFLGSGSKQGRAQIGSDDGVRHEPRDRFKASSVRSPPAASRSRLLSGEATFKVAEGCVSSSSSSEEANMRRSVATAAIALGALGASMAPAHADPSNAPNIQPFPSPVTGRPTRRSSCQGRVSRPRPWSPPATGCSSRSAWSSPLPASPPARVLPSRSASPAAARTATTTCRFEQTFTPRPGRPTGLWGSWRCCVNPRPAQADAGACRGLGYRRYQ